MGAENSRHIWEIHKNRQLLDLVNDKVLFFHSTDQNRNQQNWEKHCQQKNKKQKKQQQEASK